MKKINKINLYKEVKDKFGEDEDDLQRILIFADKILANKINELISYLNK